MFSVFLPSPFGHPPASARVCCGLPHRIARLAMVLLLALWAGIPANAAETPIRLQLKWRHQFQFAGYYAALEKGFYRQAGLEVQLIPSPPGTDPVEEVLAGRADYGVGTSSLLLSHAAGQPVVALAVIFQHSPWTLLTLAGPQAPGSLAQLAGRRVMLESDGHELMVYLRRKGIEPAAMQVVPHSQDVRDLIAGQVDAMSAYACDEPFELDSRQIPYRKFSPREDGIDFYGDNLFTTRREIEDKPERARVLRAATLQGWRYALDHPEEMAALIHEKYAPDRPLEHLRYEARGILPLVDAGTVDVGYSSPVRWQHIADTYAQAGLLPAPVDVETFLYNPDPRVERAVFLRWLAIGAAIIVLGGGISAYLLWLSRRLTAQMAERQAAERLLRRTMENMEEAIAMADPDLHLVAYNARFVEFTGIDAAYLATRPHFDELIRARACEHNLDEESTADYLRKVRLREPCRMEFAHRGRVIELHHNPMPEGGFVRTYSDVTARKRVEDDLRRSHDQFRRLLDTAPFPVFIVSRIDVSVLFANEMAVQLFGLDPGRVVGSPAGALYAEAADHTRVLARLAAADEVRDIELQMRRADGSLLWAYLSARISEFEGEPAIYAAFNDITRRKATERELEGTRRELEVANASLRAANADLASAAATDLLTGLWNRRHFERQASLEIGRAHRHASELALAMFDIDHFKQVNDHFGHAAGDAVLCALARTVGHEVRASDLFARWGGEEFVLLMPACAADEAMAVAEKLRRRLEETVFPQVGRVTASFGVAVFGAGDRLEDLLRRADRALYRAKAAGRNRVEFGPADGTPDASAGPG